MLQSVVTDPICLRRNSKLQTEWVSYGEDENEDLDLYVHLFKRRSQKTEQCLYPPNNFLHALNSQLRAGQIQVMDSI